MKLKTFTLHYQAEAGRFDDSELQEFVAGHDLLALYEHFFVREGKPVWALLLTYTERRQPGEARQPSDPRRDWRQEVPAEDRPLFEALRAWRNDLARRDGRPPYVLLTNRQVAEIAQARPQTLAALQEIPGIGAGKSEAFGEAVLALVRSVPPHVAGESQGARDAGATGPSSLPEPADG